MGIEVRLIPKKQLANKRVKVFSLPFCLLLPDGDYPVKLVDDDTVNLNLSKVTLRSMMKDFHTAAS